MNLMSNLKKNPMMYFAIIMIILCVYFGFSRREGMVPPPGTPWQFWDDAGDGNVHMSYAADGGFATQHSSTGDENRMKARANQELIRDLLSIELFSEGYSSLNKSVGKYNGNTNAAKKIDRLKYQKPIIAFLKTSPGGLAALTAAGYPGTGETLKQLSPDEYGTGDMPTGVVGGGGGGGAPDPDDGWTREWPDKGDEGKTIGGTLYSIGQDMADERALETVRSAQNLYSSAKHIMGEELLIHTKELPTGGDVLKLSSVSGGKDNYCTLREKDGQAGFVIDCVLPTF